MHDAETDLTLTLTPVRDAIGTGKQEVDVLISLRAGSAGIEANRAPLEVVFVIDTSGSMRGEPLDQVVRSAEFLIDRAQETDSFGIVRFSGGAQVVAPLALATAAHKMDAKRRLARIAAQSSTNIGAGLTEGGALFGERRRDARRAMLLLSDGQPTDGATRPSDLAKMASQLRSKVSISTMGYGPSHDEVVLGAIAEGGGGRYIFIPDPAACRVDLARAFGAQTDVVADNARLIINGVEQPCADLFAGEERLFATTVSVNAVQVTKHLPLCKVELHYRRAGRRDDRVLKAEIGIEVRSAAGALIVEAAAGVLCVRADEARARATLLAAQGDSKRAAGIVRDLIASIEASPAYAPSGRLFEAREQLLDDLQLFESAPNVEQLRAWRQGQRGDLAGGGAYAGTPRAFSPEAQAIALAVAKAPLGAALVGKNGERFPLPADGVIGRSRTCDVVVPSSSVSRQHARVFALEGEFFISDLGSSGGIYVNGAKIAVHKLSLGDRVQIGQQELVYVDVAPAENV